MAISNGVEHRRIRVRIPNWNGAFNASGEEKKLRLAHLLNVHKYNHKRLMQLQLFANGKNSNVNIRFNSFKTSYYHVFFFSL